MTTPPPPRPRPTIADLNDAFRATFLFGKVLITPGINDLEQSVRGGVIEKVMTFDDFTADNDPYGEHDFGAFDHPGVGKIFWKIDYYDPSMTCGSEDPADVHKTCRVLTIMRAEEY